MNCNFETAVAKATFWFCLIHSFMSSQFMYLKKFSLRKFDSILRYSLPYLIAYYYQSKFIIDIIYFCDHSFVLKNVNLSNWGLLGIWYKTKDFKWSNWVLLGIWYKTKDFKWSNWGLLGIWYKTKDFKWWYSFLLQQCPTCLVHLTWIFFVRGGKWPYSCCFVVCCLQDLFNIAYSILM